MTVTEAVTEKTVHSQLPDPIAASLLHMKGFAWIAFSFFNHSDSLQGIPVLSNSSYQCFLSQCKSTQCLKCSSKYKRHQPHFTYQDLNFLFNLNWNRLIFGMINGNFFNWNTEHWTWIFYFKGDLHWKNMKEDLLCHASRSEKYIACRRKFSYCIKST